MTKPAGNPNGVKSAKSPLALVLAAAKPAAGPRWRAPGHLSREARGWFRRTVKVYAVEEHHVRILIAACESWDLMNQARSALAEAGSDVLGPVRSATRPT
jgi:phage terminase small subunit